MRTSRSVLFFLSCTGVLLIALWIRTADLSAAPLHSDEAVQARITAFHFAPGAPLAGRVSSAQILRENVERDGKVFNPVHFHGPLLGYAASVSARLVGEVSWRTLAIYPLRILPAISGVAIVLLLLLSAPLVGKTAALFSAAFTAVSPFLIHYNRLFIHESLLALFLLGALLLLGYGYRNHTCLWAAGLCLGLAAATKETFVLTPVSWALAGMVVYRPKMGDFRSLLPQISAAVLAFLIVVFAFYSGFGSRFGGIWDFVSTYWRYQTGSGHEKSLFYYANLFLLPVHYGRLWWWQGGIFFLALISVFSKPENTSIPGAARFCFLAGLVQTGVYSILPYKTPWLMMVPWLHFLIAAGIGAAALLQGGPILRMVAGATLALLLAFQSLQAWRVAFKYPSDSRNPFAYVPTAPGIATWTQRSVRWLQSDGCPDGVVSVVGSHYWPLPWYFRELSRVGYWASPPDGLSTHALVVAMPEFAPSLCEKLAATHVALPEGLRSDTPVLLFVRKDIWEKHTGENR